MYSLAKKIYVDNVTHGVEVLLNMKNHTAFFMVDNFRAFYYRKLYKKQLLCIVPEDEPFYQSTMFFRKESELIPVMNEMGALIQPHLNVILNKYLNLDLIKIDSFINDRLNFKNLESTLLLLSLAMFISVIIFVFEIILYRHGKQLTSLMRFIN